MLNNGNQVLFKYYRNQVNSERKKCRQIYFHTKVKNLKHIKPKQWWSAVKKISGMNPVTTSGIFPNLQVFGTIKEIPAFEFLSLGERSGGHNCKF